MKPLQGLAKVDLVQLCRELVGSSRDWLRLVRQASSFGSEEENGRAAEANNPNISKVQATIVRVPISVFKAVIWVKAEAEGFGYGTGPATAVESPLRGERKESRLVAGFIV